MPSSAKPLVAILALALLLTAAAPARAQMSSDEQAALLLNSGKRAYNEKNYPFAADRFREFVNRFGGHRDAAQARYGLALCLSEGPERKYDQAIEQLNQLAGNRSFADYPFVLYYTGLARRGLGVKSLDLAAERVGEAAHHRGTARQRFEEAAKSFAEAHVAFSTRLPKAQTEVKAPGIDQEWAIRARCDQAEMLLHVGKAKEAREAVAPFLSDKTWGQSRYLALGLYYHGFASFQLGDSFAAGKSLGRQNVLDDEVFGTHAHYLLARIHHLNTRQNEREDARQHYQAVLKDHETAKKTAQERLRQPEQFRNDPETRTRLERLIKGPPPDHVARATFFLATLQYEDGRFGEALEHFKAFVTQYPTAALAPEARLRMGFCQAQMKQNDDAVRTLQPLVDKEPALADQALYWIARAEMNKADPAKPDSYRPAIETFRKAAERANQRVTANPPDPRARGRRGDALLDLAEAQQLSKQVREAAATYQSILNEKLLPDRDDEVLLNLATAHQLAGDFQASDRVCTQFVEKHPRSTLLPAVLFRHAENSALQALAAAKRDNPEDRARETKKYNDEAIKRYTVLVEKYPEYAHIQLARQGLGMAYYRQGDLDRARKVLEAIPSADRSGELAIVNYNLADVLLRNLPARADDAVSAGRLEEQLKAAGDLLEAYLGAGETPQTPDALLKLGYCQQRMAKLLAQPPEQQKMIAAARATYERLLQKYPRGDAAAQAAFERAKVLALQKDVNGAIHELQKFTAEPLRKTPIAPMAVVQLATLLRAQNRHADAAKVLGEARKEFEAALANDRERAGWLIALRYQTAAALREAGKLDEARQQFEEVGRSAADRPEGWDALLRAGQCQKENGETRIARGEKALAAAGNRADLRQAAEKDIGDGTQELRHAVGHLASQEQALKSRKVAAEEDAKTLTAIRARMAYEAAWGWRTLAAREVAAAREQLRHELWKRRSEELARLSPPGTTPPAPARPEVELKDVPRQPAEAEVRKVYRELIKAFPEANVNVDARFELAEVLTARQEHAEAVKLLQGALEGEKEPSPELADRIRVALGAGLLERGARQISMSNSILAAPQVKLAERAAAEKALAAGRKDVEAALEQLGPVTANEKSTVLAQAVYREAECQLQLGKLDEAIKLLTRFRDHGPFQHQPGLSDRALLRLGQAQAEKKQWDEGRRAFETLLGRFGGSPWVHEARYGIAWSQQNQGQYDAAVNTYQQVIGAVATQLAARAQLNIGVCRLLQKRYPEASTALLVVPFTYDYPELNALALMEAARACSESKQNEQAVRLLRRVIKDHPGTRQADAARARLGQLGDS